MSHTGTAIAESRQVIRDSRAAFSRLCASVARADEAIAKSQRIIEQYQASIPSADAATRAKTIVDHHQASRKAAMGKMAIDSDAQKIAAWIVQSFREAGFDCELLSAPTLH